MTWITDGSGTRWVPQQPRRQRAKPRALRFANLQPGDILIHKAKWKHEVHVPPMIADAVLANDNRRTKEGTAIGFAICEHRRFDPVAGETDPVAGEMASVRALTDRGAAPSLWRHTLRGLASNGYHAMEPHQADLVKRWMAEREHLIARCDAGLMTVKEARAAYRPWRMLIRDLGMEEIT